MIAKLQYARIFNNLNRRNKLCSSTKLSNYIVDITLAIVIFVVVNSILTSPICTVQTIVQTERKGQIGIELIIKIIEVIFLIVWGARGRWFESSYPDKMESIDNH